MQFKSSLLWTRRVCRFACSQCASMSRLICFAQSGLMAFHALILDCHRIISWVRGKLARSVAAETCFNLAKQVSSEPRLHLPSRIQTHNSETHRNKSAALHLLRRKKYEKPLKSRSFMIFSVQSAIFTVNVITEQHSSLL